MRWSLLFFGLVSTASAIVFQATLFPLDAVILPIFAVGILAYLTRESPDPGVDATNFTIIPIGMVLGAKWTPQSRTAQKLTSEPVITVADDGSYSLYLRASQSTIAGIERVSAYLTGAMETSRLSRYHLSPVRRFDIPNNDLPQPQTSIFNSDYPSDFLCSRGPQHTKSFRKLIFHDLDFVFGLCLVDDTGFKNLGWLLPVYFLAP